MKQKIYIEGFADRIDEACAKTGLPKTVIAERCGFDRKQLSRWHQDGVMNGAYLARFCQVTKTDANWLLGIKI